MEKEKKVKKWFSKMKKKKGKLKLKWKSVRKKEKV